MNAPSNPADRAPARPAPAWLPGWLTAVLLALATVALYWPALQNGFVNYDDDRYVTANPAVQRGLTWDNVQWALAHPVADNWHPLTVWSHMLVCQVAGLNPWAHHLASVVLHAANAALVFLLLRRLTGAVGKSLIVAALFAFHPLRVESVAWVAERKDVLSGFFGMLTLFFYARYAQGQKRNLGETKFFGSRDYWLSFFCLALGLMSKPMLVTWPLVLLLLDYWPLNRTAYFGRQVARSGRKNDRSVSIAARLVEKIPFFVLAVAAGVATFVVQRHGAAVETIQNLPLDARCENALIAYCRYLGKTLWPVDLAVLYPHPGYWPAMEVIAAGLFLLAVSALLVARRQQCPALLVGWLWFLGTLIPVIGLVQVGLQSMADRYTYLPWLGLGVLAVWGIDGLTRRWRSRQLPLAVLAGSAIIACACLTRMQLQYWQDGEALFRHAVAVTADNFVAQYNLGVALDDKKRSDEAMSEYRAVLQTHPDYARARVNLGLDLDRAGQPDEAMQQYEEAVRVAPNNPFARNNLGIALFKRGKTGDALDQFREAVRLDPGNAGARNSLAAGLYTAGRADEAILEFEAALRLEPDYAEAHFNLACVLAQRGRTDAAIKEFQEAIRWKPDYAEARDGLAKVLAKPIN